MQRLQPLYDTLLLTSVHLRKKLYGLIDSHIKHIADVLAPILDIEYILLIPFSVARLAFEDNIGHELHFHSNGSLSFTLLAASALGVKREIRGRKSHLLGSLLLGKQFPYLVKRFQIRSRIGTSRFTDRILIHEFDRMNSIHIARKTRIRSGHFSALSIMPKKSPIKNISD